ncbi:PP2C family protein-serine/threonine phosphatase [Streptomyces sp. NPDC046931]|uniref:PP2C family protein-serine/threonine phosphatase n=1 Tax=Streptomyces sp. NPDC046931 TaxID=3154806 RepID=UPI0033E932FA
MEPGGALTVGDVAGRGLRAVATMGRLRAATHSLAALDLTPDEMLARLDDLMVRLVDEGGPDAVGDPGEGQPSTAGCAYVIYDPASRRVDVACAGHSPPILIHPDGHAEPVEAPLGPLLGNGGPPFDTWESELPKGSSSPSTATDSSASARPTASHGFSACSASRTPACRRRATR